MKTQEFQPLTFAGITLSASAQEDLFYLQGDMADAIAEELDNVEVKLCEFGNLSEAAAFLPMIQAVITARRLMQHLSLKEG